MPLSSEDVLAAETEEKPYLREVRFGTRLCGTHPRHSGQFPRTEGGGQGPWRTHL